MGRIPLTSDVDVRNREQHMDSLSGFVVFNRVAETRSFVAAGQSLGISASAVGKRVARLEARLGVRLFHRSTRSITLTAEGTLFLERSRRILRRSKPLSRRCRRPAKHRVGGCESACLR
jgi:DNA-binding transcriptional LysR family regulator